MNFKKFFIHLGSIRKDSERSKDFKPKPVCLVWKEYLDLVRLAKLENKTLDYLVNEIIETFIIKEININLFFDKVRDWSIIESWQFLVQNPYEFIGAVYPLGMILLWNIQLDEKHWNTFYIYSDLFDDLINYCSRFHMDNISRAIRTMIRLTLDNRLYEQSLISIDLFMKWAKSESQFSNLSWGESFETYLRDISFVGEFSFVDYQLDFGNSMKSVSLSNYLKLIGGKIE